MPAYLDFDSSKKFRDAIIARTLNVPNGPQTFTSSNYSYHNQNDFANVDPGTVENEREGMLIKAKGQNVYKPEDYFLTENLNDYVRLKNLPTYSEAATSFKHETNTLISLLAINDYESESDLFKWSRNFVLLNQDGPLYQRIRQNIISSTIGKANIIDALENSSTAINIITGNERLIGYNYKITVNPSLVGKIVDFTQTVAGVETPWTNIPGNYLTDPNKEVTNSLTTGINRLFGIHEKNKVSEHPSDIMVEYMGDGQRSRLYDNLSHNTYAPDYTLMSRTNSSSSKSGLLNNITEGVSTLLGNDAPVGVGYIGNDRNNPLSKFFVEGKSTYDLAIWFDPVLKGHTGGEKNISDGGSITGSLTWISEKPSPGPMIGLYNNEFGGEKFNFDNSLSTKFTFKTSSILNKTQELLDLPSIIGDIRSNISKVIDQTSRIFKEGEQMISKGSGVLYTGYTRENFNKSGNGEELCRVWTKDRSYFNNSDLIRKNGLMRKFKNSVIDTPYNLNIAPMSSDGRSFDGSTNIISDGKHNGFYAKKYMFSIENLAWKTSNIPGFTYDDLPYCERGNNGGRVMWFPPYNLKVAEQNSVKWNENDFIGRPEPIYTYQNTTRNATISFSVIVDHPSILNYLVHEHWKNIQDVDEYINSFFSGCLEDNIDFYGLLLKYPGLTQEDLKIVLDYIKGTNDSNSVTTYTYYIDPVEDIGHGESGGSDGASGSNGSSGSSGSSGTSGNSGNAKHDIILYYKNDFPDPASHGVKSTKTYTELYNEYYNYKDDYKKELNTGIDELFRVQNSENGKNDLQLLIGKKTLNGESSTDIKNIVGNNINIAFDKLKTEYEGYTNTIKEIKSGLENGTVKNVILTILSSCSAVADVNYNRDLSFRRSHSIIKDIISQLAKTPQDIVEFNWPTIKSAGKETSVFDEIPPISLGYEGSVLTIKKVTNEGELYDKAKTSDAININCGQQNFKTSKELKRTAPLAFYCRQTTISLTSIKEPINDTGTNNTNNPNSNTNPNTNSNPNSSGSPNVIMIPNKKPAPPKPGQDQVKKIIMKILSECYYFKLLKENSPTVFSSISEQLKYFSPAFHSITPEGLNSRLTFLQQCIRPGDTIPVKGLNDDKDLNARNTSFGPPPICVLRIGDFFHSKIAIRDVNISYEDSTWDFNPEGVGMQPMIANVNMTVALIGGHGLEKPVERLQNALSFNFYGNTEIYDYRATATEDRMVFYKSTIEKIIDGQIKTENRTITDVNANEKLISGTYIGTLNNNYLVYTELITNVYNYTKDIISNYANAFTNLNETYGLKLASMMLSPKYRIINKYNIKTGSTDKLISLFGVYNRTMDLSVLADNFGFQMKCVIDSTNLTSLMGINAAANNAASEIILKNFCLELISKTVDDIKQNSTIKKIEESRNKLITELDKINFIINTSKDAKITDINNSNSVSLKDFIKNDFYNKYEPALAFIQDNIIEINSLFDDSHDFSSANTSVSDEVFSEFLGVLLNGNVQKLINEYAKNPKFNENININFAPRFLEDVNKKVTLFVNNATNKINTDIGCNIPIRSYPILSDNKPISYEITTETEILTPEQQIDLVYTLSINNNSTNQLNYYRNNG